MYYKHTLQLCCLPLLSLKIVLKVILSCPLCCYCNSCDVDFLVLIELEQLLKRYSYDYENFLYIL